MIGQTISHYKILEKLGEGGMGVVYKAQDTKLDRTVALKFLPRDVSGSEEARSRFVHEAKAVSALDHPSICTVHEIDEAPDGQLFIAMAYYGGLALNKRIAEGPLKTDEALRIAIQVVEGLQAAHEKKIIHRDIKSGNIILTDLGQAKILDFGLARKHDRTKLTRSGATLGTAAYMSPEQARGEGADHRSDLWSLGVVLYEMLTGKLPFRGDHEAALMYSIVNEEPRPIEEHVKDAPPELIHIVQRALEKDPSERYQTAADMLIDLRRLKKETSRIGYEPVKSSLGKRKSRWVPITEGIVIVAVIAGVIVISIPRGIRINPERTSRVLEVPFERVHSASLSQDGKWIIVSAEGDDGVPRLHLGTVDGRNFRSLGDERAHYPNLSPASDQVVFDSRNPETNQPEIRIASVLGGSSRPIASAGFLPQWIDGGRRIGFQRFSREGRWIEIHSIGTDGTDDRLECIDSSNVPYLQRNDAAWSPDGRKVAYVLNTADGNKDVVVFNLEKKESRRVTNDRSVIDEVVWLDNETILYSSSRGERGIVRLWVASVAGGEPRELTTGSGGFHTLPSISADGKRLLYVEENSTGELWIANVESGTATRLNLDSRRRHHPSFSPDGRRIAFGQQEPGSVFAPLWVFDRTTQESERLTQENLMATVTTWTPDGRSVLFGSLPWLWSPTGFGDGHDSVRTIVVRISNPGQTRTIGYGIPRQWLDSSSFLAHRFQLGRWKTFVNGNAQERYSLLPQDISKTPALRPIPIGTRHIAFKSSRWHLAEILPSGRYGTPVVLDELDGFGSSTSTYLHGTKAIINNAAGEFYIYDFLSRSKTPVPSTIAALLVDAEFREVSLSADGRELVIAKNRTTTRVVLIENPFY